MNHGDCARNKGDPRRRSSRYEEKASQSELGRRPEYKSMYIIFIIFI